MTVFDGVSRSEVANTNLIPHIQCRVLMTDLVNVRFLYYLNVKVLDLNYAGVTSVRIRFV